MRSFSARLGLVLLTVLVPAAAWAQDAPPPPAPLDPSDDPAEAPDGLDESSEEKTAPKADPRVPDRNPEAKRLDPEQPNPEKPAPATEGPAKDQPAAQGEGDSEPILTELERALGPKQQPSPTPAAGPKPDPLEEFRKSVQDVPTPILGALGAGVPAWAVFTAAALVSVPTGAFGFFVDATLLAPSGLPIGTVIAAAVIGAVSVVAGMGGMFAAGGVVLWLLGPEATEQDWTDLYLQALVTGVMFIGLPVVLALYFLGVPCLSSFCPTNADGLSPRVTRVANWLVGAGLGLGVAGLFLGGLVGFFAGTFNPLGGPPLGPAIPFIGLPARALTFALSFAMIGFALGLSTGAPLGALVGGAFAINAPGARPMTTPRSRRGVEAPVPEIPPPERKTATKPKRWRLPSLDEVAVADSDDGWE